jgi:hypothetical protein
MNVPIKTLAVAAVLVSAGPGHSDQLDTATTLTHKLKEYSPTSFAEQTSASLNFASVESSEIVLPQLARHRKSETGANPISFTKITQNVAARSGIGVRHQFGGKLPNGSVVMHANAGGGI